jgi:hypothetical protein
MEIDGNMYNIPKHCPICGEIVPYKRAITAYMRVIKTKAGKKENKKEDRIHG